MRRITHARPSPAMLVAVMALVAALAGTAVAEEASTSAKPVTKSKVKTIADKRIDKANLLPDDVAFVSSPPVTVANGAFGNARVACPSGQTVVGGGLSTDYAGDNAEMEASYPSSATTVPGELGPVNALGTDGWTVAVQNDGVDPLNIRAVATCVQGVANPAISGTPFKTPQSSGGASSGDNR